MHDLLSNNAIVNESAVDDALDALVPRLRQFLVVAHEEHLTRAADVLGIPQPTLSRSIARLEAELGVPLFTRPGRSIRLTRHGRFLCESAERAVAPLSASLRGLIDEADPARGRVALGFLHTLGGEAVPRLLRDFRAQHPQVRFALVQGNGHTLLSRLRDGEIDLCLTAPLPARRRRRHGTETGRAADRPVRPGGPPVFPAAPHPPGRGRGGGLHRHGARLRSEGDHR